MYNFSNRTLSEIEDFAYENSEDEFGAEMLMGCIMTKLLELDRVDYANGTHILEDTLEACEIWEIVRKYGIIR